LAAATELSLANAESTDALLHQLSILQLSASTQWQLINQRKLPKPLKLSTAVAALRASDVLKVNIEIGHAKS
jgi:predicted DNA-binding transcriptional regulator AlpA